MNGEVCDDSRESGRRLYRRVGDDSKWVRSKEATLYGRVDDDSLLVVKLFKSVCLTKMFFI